MQTVQKNVLERAIKMLDSLNLEYVVRIPDAENIVKGEFNIVDKPKRKKRVQVYARGTFRNMYRNMGIQYMRVGDVMTVPLNGFPKDTVQATLASFATDTWGSGACVTAIADGCVEIMRVDIGAKNIEVFGE